MPTNKAFDLNWSDHIQNMSGLFHNLYENNKLVDVTLSCLEGSLRAHKMILSICSPFFQRILEENPCKHPVLILQKTSLRDLKQLLDFMYTGKISVPENELSSLIQTADDLDVKGLRECIEGISTLPNDRKRPLKRTSESNSVGSAKKMIIKRSSKQEPVSKPEEHWETTNGQENSTPVEDEVAPHGRDTRFKGKKRVEVHHSSIYGSRISKPKIPKNTTQIETTETPKMVIKDISGADGKVINMQIKEEENSVDKIMEAKSPVCKIGPSTPKQTEKKSSVSLVNTNDSSVNNEAFIMGDLIPEVQFQEGDEEINTTHEESDGNISEVTFTNNMIL